jgi:hypothetical protein
VRQPQEEPNTAKGKEKELAVFLVATIGPPAGLVVVRRRRPGQPCAQATAHGTDATATWPAASDARVRAPCHHAVRSARGPSSGCAFTDRAGSSEAVKARQYVLPVVIIE